MENYSQPVLTFLKIIFWIMIIGLTISTIVLICVAARIVLNYETDFFQNMKINIGDFKGQIKDLAPVEKWKTLIVLSLVIFYAMIEIKLLELILKVLNKINFNSPFSLEISNLISKIVSTAVFLGILTFIGSMILNLILKSELNISIDFNNSDFHFLVFAGVIYIIGRVYQKGVDLQNENDLTI